MKICQHCCPVILVLAVLSVVCLVLLIVVPMFLIKGEAKPLLNFTLHTNETRKVFLTDYFTGTDVDILTTQNPTYVLFSKGAEAEQSLSERFYFSEQSKMEVLQNGLSDIRIRLFMLDGSSSTLTLQSDYEVSVYSLAGEDSFDFIYTPSTYLEKLVGTTHATGSITMNQNDEGGFAIIPDTGSPTTVFFNVSTKYVGYDASFFQRPPLKAESVEAGDMFIAFCPPESPDTLFTFTMTGGASIVKVAIAVAVLVLVFIALLIALCAVGVHQSSWRNSRQRTLAPVIVAAPPSSTVPSYPMVSLDPVAMNDVPRYAPQPSAPNMEPSGVSAEYPDGYPPY